MAVRTTNSKWNSNFKDVKKKLLQLEDVMDTRVRRAMEQAITDITEVAFAKALEYAPMEQGHLRNSGRIEDIQWSGSIVKTSISFGNETVNYAYFVHEDMPSAVEPKNYTTSGTGPKYLQRAVEEIVTDENLRQAFANAMKNQRGKV